MDTHTTPPALEEPTLNELEDETDNDCSPQEEDTTEDNEDGIPQSTTETPTAQEFVELNYKGFNIKLGSCRLIVSQLADLSFNYYNLLTKGGLPNEPKNKSYLS